MSLKAYLAPERTLAWAGELGRALATATTEVEIVVFPETLVARDVGALLLPRGVSLGLQDISAFAEGPYTGETPAAHAAAAGVRYAEIGHSERRRLFGETDDVVARKVVAARRSGLIPFVCVGEPFRGKSRAALAFCLSQLHAFLPHAEGAPLVVAYEPVWAIGAAEPAPAAHVREVCAGLRAVLADHPDARVIYGGSAGAGLHRRLEGCVDGLFLGRFAHSIPNLMSIVAEMSPATAPEG